ncbi:preprotein translocase subunit YajC [Zafaria sp. Z1313]|uniref:preprotein translocase subunit YajC n=1 Tax=unclassified Zafaria TaxID=2828765 RepID=UPI002E770814|nr:preprotein translocase subunit YajC [Zafaria sp. J156]MEE1621103.1 preprotein translocase subunit YajC [Zafaria sp. J156]
MTITVLAQNSSEQAPQGGFDPMSLILFAAIGLLIFMMFRTRRKARAQQEQMKSQLAPGSQVMTQFGLFGTVVSIDAEENKVVLELSPGSTATVHSQAIARVMDAEPAAEEQAPAGTSSLDETPEETLRRLEEDGKNKE